jgi:putative membrane protein
MKNAFNYEKDGLGPYGIQVLVIEVNGEKVAYLLYDGNNMDKGLREKLRNSVKDIVNESEVLTTDNHIVNATMGGYNPVGKNMSHDLIVEKTKSLVKNAIENLEEVEIGTSSGYVEEVHVFGHENTARLTSVINSLISTMKLTSALSIAFAVSASILTIVFFG